MPYRFVKPTDFYGAEHTPRGPWSRVVIEMADDQSPPWVATLLTVWTSVALVFGITLAVRGAWLVPIFIAPVCVGLRHALKARPRRASRETLSIGPVQVLHRQTNWSGDSAVRTLSRFQCTLEISDTAVGAQRLLLRDGRTNAEIGACLPNPERLDLARELSTFFKN